MLSLLWWDSPRAGINYLVVPKSGCTSNQIAIATLELGEDDSRLKPLEEDEMAIHDPIGIHRALYERVDKARYDAEEPGIRPFRFTWVRSPLPRFASFYRDKVKRAEWNEFGAMGFRNEMTACEALEHVMSIPALERDLHFINQHEIIFCHGKERVDFIGRLEEFDRDIEIILAKSKIPAKREWWRPRNRVSGEWRDVYHSDHAAADLVYEVYEQDFELFSYDLDEWEK